jgi:ferredoxin
VVDLNRCEGYGQCAFLAPGVFTMSGDEALSYVAEPPDSQHEFVDRAATACPVRAILIERPGVRAAVHVG